MFVEFLEAHDVWWTDMFKVSQYSVIYSVIYLLAIKTFLVEASKRFEYCSLWIQWLKYWLGNAVDCIISKVLTVVTVKVTVFCFLGLWHHDFVFQNEPRIQDPAIPLICRKKFIHSFILHIPSIHQRSSIVY
jgi:hypothetical protein